jgi:hypothetical protein
VFDLVAFALHGASSGPSVMAKDGVTLTSDTTVGRIVTVFADPRQPVVIADALPPTRFSEGNL